MTTHQTALLTTGERLRLARERAGYSPGEFAERARKHRNNVPRWESRFGDPSLRVVRMYAEILGNTTEQWLLFEIGDWPPLIDGAPPPPAEAAPPTPAMERPPPQRSVLQSRVIGGYVAAA